MQLFASAAQSASSLVDSLSTLPYAKKAALLLEDVYSYDLPIDWTLSDKVDASEAVNVSHLGDGSFDMSSSDRGEHLGSTSVSHTQREIVLVDDHCTHPRIVRHIPNKGFYVCQLHLNKEQLPHDDTFATKESFIQFPYGSNLLCVRFLPTASMLPMDSTISLYLDVFAFLYTMENGKSIVGVWNVSTSPDSALFLNLVDKPDQDDLGVDGCLETGINVLGLFWIVPEFAPSNVKNRVDPSLLAVMTGYGFSVIECTEAHYRKTQTEVAVGSILNVWWEELSHYILLGQSGGFLQPYRFSWQIQRFQKLQGIDLALPRWKNLEPFDVCLMKVYDSTLCLHADAANGRVSIRNLTMSTTFDLLLDLQGPGQLRLQRVDNVLIIHRPDRAETHLFDLKGTTFNENEWCERPLKWSDSREIFATPISIEELVSAIRLTDQIEGYNVTPVVTLPRKPREKGLTPSKYHPFDTTQYPDSWDLRSTNGLIIDSSQRLIKRLLLNSEAISWSLAKCGATPIQIARFLLRRCNASSPLIALLRFELAKLSPTLPLLFECITKAYRDAIVDSEVRHSSDANTAIHRCSTQIHPSQERMYFPHWTSIGLHKLSMHSQHSRKRPWVTASFTVLSVYQRIALKTVLTEKDILLKVLLPFLSEIFGSPLQTTLDEQGTLKFQVEKKQLSLKTSNEEQVDSFTLISQHIGKDEVAIEKTKSLLHCSLQFAKILLAKAVLPHRMLTTFLFELTLFAKQHDLLQQLFQFHVLTDCADTQLRLLSWWKYKKVDWVGQMVMDLSVKLQKWDVVIDLLIERKEYLRATVFLRKKCLFSYPIARLLSQLSDDLPSQVKDPYLIPSVLTAIRDWTSQQSLIMKSQLGQAAGDKVGPKQKDDWRDGFLVGMTETGSTFLRAEFPNIANCQKWFPDLSFDMLL